MRIHLGISTCPNDTFAFHAILERRVDLRGLEFEVELADVEELNQRLLGGEFDAAKGSFAALLALTDELGVLPAGSALGSGVGPLLLAAHPGASAELPADARVLCPGEHTTAHLLLRLLHPELENIEHVVFSDIMPALSAGRAELGVCIHEGRFTWEASGLGFVEDLGERWESETSALLPLGGILARRRLGTDVLERLAQVVRDSVEYALAHRAETRPTMQRHAQELALDVIEAHVDLYVNEHTVELGPSGVAALGHLERRARAAGLTPESAAALEVLGRTEHRPTRLFHLVPCESWSGHEEWRPASLATEGFVHLSFAHQLDGTLAAHFAGAGELFLLEVELEGDGLVIEASRGGAPFPHLYRALRRGEVVRHWRVRPESGPPSLGAHAGQDRDRGTPGPAPITK